MFEKIKKENFIILITVIFLFSLLAINQINLSGFAVEASQFGTVVGTNEFSANPNSQQIMKGSTSVVNAIVKGDYILPYIRVYTRNEGWKKIDLTGKISEDDSNWLSGEAKTEITVSQENNFHGNNIIVGYSCNKNGNDLDCHGDNYISTSFNLDFVFPQQTSTQAQQNSQVLSQQTRDSCKNTCGQEFNKCNNECSGWLMAFCRMGCSNTKSSCDGKCNQDYGVATSGQAQPASPAQASQPAQAAQPSSGAATTTNTQCPNLCNMQPGISYNILGKPRQCVLAKKYNPSTGKVYTGTSPGVCQGEAKVKNSDLSSINSPRYNYFISAAQEINVPCECKSGIGYVI